MYQHTSEVVRLRQCIEAEIEAMQHGFSAFAAGVARHNFIKMRMEQIGGHQERLAGYVGEHVAADMVCELYIHTAAGNIQANSDS